MPRASARRLKRPPSPRVKQSAAEECRTASELAQALAALRRHTAEIIERKKQLKQLNRWFDVALNNMGRGLSMFDAEQRLIVCNRLYREIYGLPQRLTRPGTPLASIVRYHVKHETGCDDREEIARQCKWIEQHVANLARGQTFSYTQHLKNGRIVQVTNQPLTGGGWVDIQEDITERRRAEQKIAWLAHHDPLTEVANRIYFAEELEHALGHLEPGAGFALHWIDLDRFKEINDHLGHPAGDALLKSVAGRLLKTVREHDLVARLGGDEFAVIQASAKTQAEAEELTKRLLSALSQPHKVLEHEITIGASIGVVVAPKHGASAEELMKNVDLALYKAKQAGRGTYAIFEPGYDYSGQASCEPAGIAAAQRSLLG